MMTSMKQSGALAARGAGVFIVTVALVSAMIVGCGLFRGITYYDPTTYTNLTDLKPEVTLLYESFTNADLDSVWIRSIRLRLAQMYEYEKGKGERNNATTEQIEIIREMFNRHVMDRMSSGIWSTAHMVNAKENISDAFDDAIETEALKNRNVR